MSHFAKKVVMIQPQVYEFNPETGQDNAYMLNCIRSNYLSQFLSYKSLLTSKGIEVIHWHNPDPNAKDSIFANNWFTTLSAPDVFFPTLILCPMRHASRRLERQESFVQELSLLYPNIINLTFFEEQGLYLEGTGSLVIDRKQHKIFMSRSERSCEQVLDYLIQEINKISQFIWKKVVFDASDDSGKCIYHTNIVLALTDSQAVVNLECLNEDDKKKVSEELEGYEIVRISQDDSKNFVGNVEVLDCNGEVTAFVSLRGKGRLELKCHMEFVDICDIEDIGGGSTQCMLGKLF